MYYKFKLRILFLFINAFCTGNGNTSPLLNISETEKNKTGFSLHSKKTYDSDSGDQRTSEYFLSQNAAGWSAADEDCKALLGPDSGLLSIKTLEELCAINEFLECSNSTLSGTTYWIGGRYNPTKDGFTWDNGEDIPSWAPWDIGYPDSKYPVTRMLAFVTDQGLKFRTHFQTESFRYICEFKE